MKLSAVFRLVVATSLETFDTGLCSIEEAGVNVLTTRDRTGRTPLMAAAQHANRAPVIRFLIAAGGDVNAKTKSGFTALRAAVLSRSLKGIKAR